MVEVTYEEVVAELNELNSQLVALAYERIKSKKLTALVNEMASQLEAQTRDPSDKTEYDATPAEEGVEE